LYPTNISYFTDIVIWRFVFLHLRHQNSGSTIFFIQLYTKDLLKTLCQRTNLNVKNHSSRAFFSQTTDRGHICGINTWEIILEPFSRAWVDSIKTSWMLLDTSKHRSATLFKKKYNKNKLYCCLIFFIRHETMQSFWCFNYVGHINLNFHIFYAIIPIGIYLCSILWGKGFCRLNVMLCTIWYQVH